MRERIVVKSGEGCSVEHGRIRHELQALVRERANYDFVCRNVARVADLKDHANAVTRVRGACRFKPLSEVQRAADALRDDALHVNR